MKKIMGGLFLGLGLLASNNATAFSAGEQYGCDFNQILRFYEDRAPYFTDSYSNQSPFSFVVENDKIKMGENWFVGSSLPIIDSGDDYLTAFDGRDLLKLRKNNGRVSGYAGTLDGYIKMFYVTCRRL